MALRQPAAEVLEALDDVGGLAVERRAALGGGTPFFTALDSWVNLTLVENRTFPNGVVLTRYETRR